MPEPTHETRPLREDERDWLTPRHAPSVTDGFRPALAACAGLALLAALSELAVTPQKTKHAAALDPVEAPLR